MGVFSTPPSKTIYDPFDLAWAAGLFEGEGHVNIKHRRLYVSSSDLDVLKRFKDVVKCGTIIKLPLSKLGNKAMWRWEVSNWMETSNLAVHLGPHMGTRRAKAIEELLNNKPKFAHTAKYGHCNRGHKFDEVGVYVEPTSGHSRCRECLRMKEERRKIRRKEKLNGNLR